MIETNREPLLSAVRSRVIFGNGNAANGRRSILLITLMGNDLEVRRIIVEGSDRNPEVRDWKMLSRSFNDRDPAPNCEFTDIWQPRTMPNWENKNPCCLYKHQVGVGRKGIKLLVWNIVGCWSANCSVINHYMLQRFFRINVLFRINMSTFLIGFHSVKLLCNNFSYFNTLVDYMILFLSQFFFYYSENYFH